jgi:hypothetical protein
MTTTERRTTESQTVIREGCAWGIPQSTSYGPSLNMVTERLASYADVAAGDYGTVAYVREVAEEDFVGDSDYFVLA